MHLSITNKTLLSQHLHWASKGYDIATLKTITNAVEDEHDDPFVGPTLHQITAITGKPFGTDFELDQLNQLQYLRYKYFNFDKDLSFLRYCTDLEEIDFCCCNIVEDITNLRYLKNLKKLLITNSKINSTEALIDLTELETISLSGCETNSLAPLLHHKKIKQISLGLIGDENEILQIISNQKNCNASYVIKSNFELLGIENIFLYVSIQLKENSLTIEMKAVSNLKNLTHFEKLPEHIKNDKKQNAYFEFANIELEKRILALLNSNFQEITTERFYSRDEISFKTKIENLNRN